PCEDPSGEELADTGFAADPSWTAVEEHPGAVEGYVPTLQEEIDTLQAEPAEVSRIYYYESLAAGTYRIEPRDHVVSAAAPRPESIDDLIVLAGQGWTPLDGGRVRTQGLGTVLASASVVAGIGYFYYWRIETAGDRAEQLANQHYPGVQGNTRADAFRHAFLSVQLRRYSTAWIAKMITDDHENRYSESYAEERMDQHNNYLGREVKYEHFRGHWLADRWDWKEWSTRVRSYINGTDRGEFIPEWARSANPTNDAIGARQRAVPKWKYIFIHDQ
ncbi:MAG TPA: hypothetical protein VE913_11440, partial [Longimicrobium sp.]|nr:hypothetical protein [Longimicrobium sp.]